MKLELNIEKRHFWAIIAVIALVGAALLAVAGTAPNAGGVWHVLKLVSTDDTGTKSVDDDGNGVIDASQTSQSIKVNSASHPNSYKGCIAASSPAGTPSGSKGWNLDDFPATAVVNIDLMVDGENICADADGCLFYIWQTTDAGKVQWATADDNMFMMQNAAGYGIETGRWGNDLFNGEYTNGDNVRKNLFGYDGCALVDDYDGTNNAENDINKITLLDGNSADRCYIRICD